MAETKHLWEIDAPYYISEGNYYSNDCHTEFKSWGEFVSGFGDADLDYNWFVAFEWREGEDHGLAAYNGDDNYRHANLVLQMIGRRKARLMSFTVWVCRADEPAILEFLKHRWDYMLRMWEPFSEPRS